MFKITRFFFSIAAVFFLVFTLSTLSAADSIKQKLVLGNAKSPIEVYFISDWFCPSCKKAEPEIEDIYAKVQSKVAFYFVDHAIHKNSLNYTSYNLSFLVNDKPQYLALRKALLKLTDKTETPSDSDIEAIAKKEHAQFQDLPYTDVKAGLDFFEKVVQKYEIRSTPVLIVVNNKTDKFVKLAGAKKIKEKSVLKAIDEVK